MIHIDEKNIEEATLKLKWLMFARVLFTTLLLGSTIVLQLGEAVSPVAPAMLVLYTVIVSIFCLSAIYSMVIVRVRRVHRFAFLQLSVDTVIVSLIIMVTGNYFSIFSFLYLVVIIYSSILLFRNGSVFMAVLCSIQYASLLLLEYAGVLTPFEMEESLRTADFTLTQLSYKILITTLGCFAVAFLSSLLAEQARKSKKELWEMEDHVRRVEKLAAVGEMAAGLAHEIKNPLASLTGSIQILRDGIHLEPDHSRLMQIVLREADRLGSLVNNFLLFARPPAGKAEPIELSKALNETVELLARDSSCKGRISIRQDVPAGMVVEMDPVHLRQVLWNLLLNAAEAIDGESGRIDITVFPIKGKTVAIEISDNGCGISNEAMQSIFDPFFTTKPSGTGLGLSIVHSIVESYDSHLDVRSKEGVGTTFTMYLQQADHPTKT